MYGPEVFKFSPNAFEKLKCTGLRFSGFFRMHLRSRNGRVWGFSNTRVFYADRTANTDDAPDHIPLLVDAGHSRAVGQISEGGMNVTIAEFTLGLRGQRAVVGAVQNQRAVLDRARSDESGRDAARRSNLNATDISCGAKMERFF